jgi:uncharacterized membrane protein
VSAPARRRVGPAWIWPTTAAVVAAGLGVSVYLTIEHYTAATTLACPDTGVVNCLKVTTSPQSTMLGIPVAVLGLVFFVAMGLLTLPALWHNRSAPVRRGRLALAAVGIVTVLYLLYAELFLVDAVCLWCTAVHLLTFVLFVLVGYREAEQPPRA